MKTIAQVSKETLTLEAYLKTIKPGTFLSYDVIEKDTMVKMDNQGKSFLRTAKKRAKIECSCRKGEGIELASAETSMNFVVCGLKKVGNAAKRSEKTNRNITLQFYSEMSIIAQKQLNFINAAYGAVRSAIENGKAMVLDRNINKEKPIELPKM